MEIWRNYSEGPVLSKWEEYTETYERLFKNYKYGKKITMLEIGVQSGGSMVMWNSWFADAQFTYVGIDANPLCKQLDTSATDQTYIEIGSQNDVDFLEFMCEKYGPFDIVVDDGGHSAENMITSLRALFPCVTDDGIYVVEDTCTVAAGHEEFTTFEGKTFPEHVAQIYRSMHDYWVPFFDANRDFYGEVDRSLYDPVFSNTVREVRMVDSMIVLEKKPDRLKRNSEITRGTQRIPMGGTTQSVSVEYYKPGSTELTRAVFTSFVATSSLTFDKAALHAKIKAFCAEHVPNTGNNDVRKERQACTDGIMRQMIFKTFASDDAFLYDYVPPADIDEFGSDSGISEEL